MTSPDELVEDLVFRCLEADDPDAALAAVAREHPEFASRVQKIYRVLAGSDLLPGPPRSRPRARDRIGGFRIVRELGAGGMGVVYLADQPELGRSVALKVVRPEFLGVQGSRDRFRREVEAASSLQHPSIVQVYTVGEDGGWPYFAMEYVAGCTLAEVVQALRDRDPGELRGAALLECAGGRAVTNGSATTSGRRPFAGSFTDACVAVVRQVADALAHAHARGVLHRDLKPSNVLLSPDGRARLTDFGLAKVEGAQDLTRSTTQMGSLPYLPPECLGTKPPIASPTLDVYQLGVTLYELLALRHPYRADNPEQTRRNVLEGRPPALRSRNRAVSRELETVCLVAMDPVPAQRYATVEAFARDLDNLVARRPIEARRPGLPTRTWRWAQRHPSVAIASVVALVLLALGAALFAGIERSARLRGEELTRTARYEQYRSNIAAASAMLSDLANPGRARTLLEECPEEHRGFEWRHLASLLDAGTVLHQGREAPVRICWADGGRSVVVAERGHETARFFDAATGELRREVPLGDVTHDLTDISATEGLLFVGHRSGSITVHAESGAVVKTLRDFAAIGEQSARVVAAIPGGRFVYGSYGDGDILVWDVAAGRIHRRLAEGTRYLRKPSFSGDGRLLAFVDALAGRVEVWDANTWRKERSLVATAKEVALHPSGDRLFLVQESTVFASRAGTDEFYRLPVPDAQRLAVSGNGSRFAVTERDRRIAVYDFDPAGETAHLVARLGGHTGRIEQVLLDASGDVACSAGENLSARHWRLANRRGAWQVGSGFPVATAMAFAPDQRNLIVATANGGMALLDLVSGDRRELPSPHGFFVRSIRSHPSRLVAAGYDGSVSVWSWPALEQTKVLRAEGVSVTCVAIHPDGRTLVSGEAGGEVSVWDSETGERTDHWPAHGVFVSDLAFSPDGRYLLTAGEDGTLTTWTWPGRTLHRHYEGYRGWLGRAAFLGGGKEVVAAGQDPRVCVWDRDTGRLLRQCRGHSTAVFDLAVSGDGERLFTCDLAQEVHVWDRRGERSLLVLDAPDTPMSLAVSGDGTHVAVGGIGSAIKVFGSSDDLPPQPPLPDSNGAGDGLRPSAGYRTMQRLHQRDNGKPRQR